MCAVGALDFLAFLAEEAIGRTRLEQLFPDDLFGLAVGCGNEVARSFHGNLQVLHFAEITSQRLSCLEGSLNHDIEKS